MANDSLAYAFRFGNDSQRQAPPTVQQPRGGGGKGDTLAQPALTDELLQTGVDGYQAYYDAFSTMNNFGQEMMAKFGIDVKSPSPSNPEAIDAYRTYNQLYNRAAELGNRLAVGQKTQEAMNKAALEGKIFLPARFKDGKITSSGKPMEALPAGQEEQVTEFNDILSKTKIVSDKQLKDFEMLRDGIVDYFREDYYESLVNAGYDPDYAMEYIEDQVSQLMKPGVDENARQLNAYRWAEHGRKKAGDTGNQEDILRRAQIIQDILSKASQGQESEYLGMLYSGQSGSDKIMGAGATKGNQELRDKLNAVGVEDYPPLIKKLFKNLPALASSLDLNIAEGKVKGQTQGSVERIDPYSPDAWTQINNILNSAPGQKRIETEKLMDVMQGQQQQGVSNTDNSDTPPEITTQAEYDALQPGDTYMWDGVEYIKE